MKILNLVIDNFRTMNDKTKNKFTFKAKLPNFQMHKFFFQLYILSSFYFLPIYRCDYHNSSRNAKISNNIAKNVNNNIMINENNINTKYLEDRKILLQQFSECEDKYKLYIEIIFSYLEIEKFCFSYLNFKQNIHFNDEKEIKKGFKLLSMLKSKFKQSKYLHVENQIKKYFNLLSFLKYELKQIKYFDVENQIIKINDLLPILKSKFEQCFSLENDYIAQYEDSKQKSSDFIKNVFFECLTKCFETKIQDNRYIVTSSPHIKYFSEHVVAAMELVYKTNTNLVFFIHYFEFLARICHDKIQQIKYDKIQKYRSDQNKIIMNFLQVINKKRKPDNHSRNFEDYYVEHKKNMANMYADVKTIINSNSAYLENFEKNFLSFFLELMYTLKRENTKLLNKENQISLLFNNEDIVRTVILFTLNAQKIRNNQYLAKNISVIIDLGVFLLPVNIFESSTFKKHYESLFKFITEIIKFNFLILSYEMNNDEVDIIMRKVYITVHRNFLNSIMTN